MQHLSAADSMPMNGRGKRHSYSSDSDSRNRLDLDKALEALQSQQLQLRHENHRTVSAPPQQYQQQYVVENGGAGGGASAVEEQQQQRNMQSLKRNVHKHKDYQLAYNAPIAAPADDDVNDNNVDDDDALSVENTRL